MSKTGDELDSGMEETLWPADSRIVRWSFGVGFAILVMLVVISHLYAPN
jgi:hypothetical protein